MKKLATILLLLVLLSCKKEQPDYRDVFVGDWYGTLIYDNDVQNVHDTTGAFRTFTKGLETNDLNVRWLDAPSTTATAILYFSNYEYRDITIATTHGSFKTILIFSGTGTRDGDTIFEFGTGEKWDNGVHSTFNWSAKVVRK
jgi:hypothetical protein